MEIGGRLLCELVMNIGEMRHRLTFQEPTETRDAMGGISTAWPEKDWLTVWAAIWPLKDKELAESMKLQGRMVRRIRVRYRSDLHKKQRIHWANEGIYLNINSITNVAERGAYLDILAEEVE